MKKWFEDNGIPFELINIFSGSLKAEDIREAITKSENGTDDIISRRSKVFQESGVDFDDMTISELVDFVLANPSVLKRPIILDDRKMQVGYNSEEIDAFMPQAKKLAILNCTPECKNWATCNGSDMKNVSN